MPDPLPESVQGQFRHLIETMADGVLLIDTTGAVVYVNSAAQALFGRTEKEMIGSFLGIPQERAEPVEFDIFPSGSPPRVVEMRVVETRWNGQPARLASLRDITAHKALQASLKAAEAEKRILLDSLSEIILYLLPDLKIGWGNLAAARFADTQVDELVGKKCIDIWHGCGRRCKDCPAVMALESLRPQSGECRSKDKTVWKMRAYPVIPGNHNNRGVLLLAFDITRIRVMEKQIDDQALYRTLCEMAGGISHDYNNFLNIIDGYLELAKNTLDEVESARESLSKAQSAITKAADLTHRFMILSESTAPTKQATDLHRLLEKAARKAVTQPHIDWQLHVDIPDSIIHVDPFQLSMAITQVLANACEAMQQAGTIRIEAGLVPRDRHSLGKNGTNGVDLFVRISIRDQGTGIQDEHLSQLFTPYFSTKQRGTAKGMGLGLTTAFVVVRKHGGYISISSKLDKGTRVDIYIDGNPPDAAQGEEKGMEEASSYYPHHLKEQRA